MLKVKFLILSIILASIQATLPVIAAPKTVDRYSEAKKEIPEDVYPVYRALERLLQTNKVDGPVAITVRSTTPEQCEAMTGNKGMCAVLGDLPDVKAKDSMIAWAVQVVSSTNFLPNASADGGNLIRMGKSLMNGLIDKPAAMTCVVAHELAHITEGHIKKIQIRNSELDLKTSDKVASAIKNAHNAQKSSQFWAGVAMGLNAFSSGLNASQGNYALANQASMNNQYLALSLQAESAAGANEYARYIGANYNTLQRNAPKTLDAMKSLEGLYATYVKKTKVDIDQYLDEHKIELQTFSREQELEADAKGVEFMAKAGLDPKSCLDVQELIHRTSGDKTTSITDSHPGEEERKAKLEKIIAEIMPQFKINSKVNPVKQPILPYVYDKETQVVRIMPQGTPGMKAGKNNKSSSIDALLGN